MKLPINFPQIRETHPCLAVLSDREIARCLFIKHQRQHKLQYREFPKLTETFGDEIRGAFEGALSEDVRLTSDIDKPLNSHLWTS